MALAPGAKAPDFDLPTSAGGRQKLSALRGKRVLLYFYPKDDTPGCTLEACSFRDHHATWQKAGVVVLGVSKDSLSEHAAFRKKYELPFALLVDADNAVATAYGAFGEKFMYGKKVTGSIRSTYLIDADGLVEKAWSPVRVEGHADQVDAAITGGIESSGGKVVASAKGGAKTDAKAVKPAGKGAAKPAAAKTAAKAPAGTETGPVTTGAKKAGAKPAKKVAAKPPARKAKSAKK